MTANDADRGRRIAESGKYKPAQSVSWDNGEAEAPPDGATLLDDVRTFLARFVVYPSCCHGDAHALWIAHTWWMDHWESTPRIAFLSPEPGSGKSRALEVTEPLVPRPVHAINTTPAYLFRKVSDPLGRPTILYDECDTLFGPKAKEHEEIRGVINAGHRKGATAGRCVVRGKLVETEELPAYCAVALAGLDDLPDTVMSRAVIVRMKRRTPAEMIEPWRRRINGPDAADLYKRLLDWSTAVTPLADGWPEMPACIADRDADVWEALLAVADLAGGHWPQTARVAAATLVTETRAANHPSLGVRLLGDLRAVFRRSIVKALPTAEILEALNGMDESPWPTVRRGQPLDARGLANRLSRYGITPQWTRLGQQTFRGYSGAEFADAWARYLPDDDPLPSRDLSVASVASVTSQVSGALGATDATDADEAATDATDATDFLGAGEES